MGHNSDEQLFDPSRFSKPRRLSPQSLTLTRWVRIVHSSHVIVVYYQP